MKTNYEQAREALDNLFENPFGDYEFQVKRLAEKQLRREIEIEFNRIRFEEDKSILGIAKRFIKKVITYYKENVVTGSMNEAMRR